MGVSVLEAVHATVLVAGEAAYARLRQLTDNHEIGRGFDPHTEF